MRSITTDIDRAGLKLTFGEFDFGNEADQALYMDIFETCFGVRSNINMNTFSWFNLKNPEFINRNFFLKDSNNGLIVAAYGLLPTELIIEGKVSVSAICTNVMVHPSKDYRGKGLFQLIGQLSLTELRETMNMQLAFGVPNKAAIKGHLRIGWQRQPDLRFLERRVEGNREITSNKEVIQVDNYLGALSNEELQTFYRKYRFYYKRSVEIIDWRFDKPNENYTKLLLTEQGSNKGFLVYKIYSDGVTGNKKFHILDFGYDQLSHLQSLLDEVLLIAQSLRCERINLWSIDSRSEELDLFFSSDFCFSEDSNMLIFYTDLDFDHEDFSGFHICLADNDVY